jgi:hypothetical protein
VSSKVMEHLARLFRPNVASVSTYGAYERPRRERADQPKGDHGGDSDNCRDRHDQGFSGSLGCEKPSLVQTLRTPKGIAAEAGFLT